MNIVNESRICALRTLKESLTDEAYTAIMDEAESLLESGVVTNEADAINFAASKLVDDEAQELIEAVINEGFLSPMKSKLKMLEEIRRAKPKDYDGPKEVKEFVDKYYDDLVKCANVLEKEPSELRRNDVIGICSWISGPIAGFAGAGALSTVAADTALGTAVYLSPLVLGIVGPLVFLVINWVRANHDRKASDELSKIRTSLKKINAKKLPEAQQRKIADIIAAIDDADTEMSARFKTMKEDASEVIDESLDNAKLHMNNAKIYGAAARSALHSPRTELGSKDGPVFKNKNAAKFLAHKATQELGSAAKEAIKDKRVQAGAAGLGVAALAAKKLHDAKKAKEAEKEDLNEGAVKELKTILNGDAKTTKTSSQTLINTAKRYAKDVIADDKRRNNPREPLTEKDFIGESTGVMSVIWGTDDLNESLSDPLGKKKYEESKKKWKAASGYLKDLIKGPYAKASSSETRARISYDYADDDRRDLKYNYNYDNDCNIIGKTPKINTELPHNDFGAAHQHDMINSKVKYRKSVYDSAKARSEALDNRKDYASRQARDAADDMIFDGQRYSDNKSKAKIAAGATVLAAGAVAAKKLHDAHKAKKTKDDNSEKEE